MFVFVTSGIAIIACFGLVVLYRWIAVKPQALSDDKLRAEWYEYLRTDPRIRRIRDSTISDFLLAEAKYLVAGKLDSIKNSELKASSQLAIVGGGVGLLSVFGANQAPIIHGLKDLIIFGACLLLGSIIVNVICIAIGSTDALPNIDVYNSEEVNAMAELKARISVSLTEGYLDYATELGALSRRKGRLQKVATYGFMGGVICLVVNYGVAALNQPQPAPHEYRCDAGNKTITCKEILNDSLHRRTSGP